MQKVNNINTLISFFLLLAVSLPGWTQPVLGQAIEQAKKTKLSELFPAAVEDLSPTPRGTTPGVKVAPPEPPPPVLWALSGINGQLNAEVLLADVIQRFPVVHGYVLQGGWVVVSGDARALTLRRGKRELTLFPPAPGTTGSEFVGLRKVKSADGDLLNALSGSTTAGRSSQVFAPPTPNQPPPPNLNAARQAAGSLPPKP